MSTGAALKELVTLANIERWVAENPQATFYMATFSKCCVAQFLRQHGHPAAEVGVSIAYYVGMGGHGDYYWPLPEEIARLVGELGSMSVRYSNQAAITGEQSLPIIHKLIGEYA